MSILKSQFNPTFLLDIHYGYVLCIAWSGSFNLIFLLLLFWRKKILSMGCSHTIERLNITCENLQFLAQNRFCTCIFTTFSHFLHICSLCTTKIVSDQVDTIRLIASGNIYNNFPIDALNISTSLFLHFWDTLIVIHNFGCSLFRIYVRLKIYL